MKNLTPTKVETRSFNDQLIVCESDELQVEIHIKKSEMFTSLDELIATGFESEILKLQIVNSDQGKVDELNAELLKANDSLQSQEGLLTKALSDTNAANAKADELNAQLTKANESLTSQGTLLAQAQNDLVTANAKINELQTAAQVAPAPVVGAGQ